jgi:hypothetical protein
VPAKEFHPVKYFLFNEVKKMKSLDLPDLIGAVKSKKLPKEAIRGVLTRFKAG